MALKYLQIILYLGSDHAVSSFSDVSVSVDVGVGFDVDVGFGVGGGVGVDVDVDVDVDVFMIGFVLMFTLCSGSDQAMSSVGEEDRGFQNVFRGRAG